MLPPDVIEFFIYDLTVHCCQSWAVAKISISSSDFFKQMETELQGWHLHKYVKKLSC